MKISEAFEIGFIARTHGLKGGLVAHLSHDLPASTTLDQAIFVEQRGTLVPYFIEAVASKGEQLYITFQDVASLEAAEKLVRCRLFLPRSSRPKLKGIEFYDDEVIGFSVIQKETQLGTVSGIVWSGPQRMLEIKDGKELLIPVSEAFLKRVDRRGKTIQVELPEGFLDL